MCKTGQPKRGPSGSAPGPTGPDEASKGLTGPWGRPNKTRDVRAFVPPHGVLISNVGRKAHIYTIIIKGLKWALPLRKPRHSGLTHNHSKVYRINYVQMSEMTSWGSRKRTPTRSSLISNRSSNPPAREHASCVHFASKCQSGGATSVLQHTD